MEHELKTPASVRASGKASYVTRKYELPKKLYINGEYFVLSTSHKDFEKLLGRQPREIFSENMPDEIPLGTSAVDAVVSLYGLTENKLYISGRFQKLCKNLPTGPEKIVAVMRAAAYVKYDDNHDTSYNYDCPIERSYLFLNISPAMIVEAFRELRG